MTRPLYLAPLLLASLLLAPACADDGDQGEPEATTGATTGDESDSDPDPSPAGSSTGGDPSTGEAETAAGDSSSEGGDTTGDEIDVDALYDCEDPMLLVGLPLTGPGIDPETGELLPPLQDSYIVHTTQLMIKPEAQEQFDELTGAVMAQLMETEGVVGVALAYEPTCDFYRTMGIWEDERSLMLFVGTGVHAQAMGQTAEISLTGRTTHWTVSADELPLTWEMAIEQVADVDPSSLYD